MQNIHTWAISQNQDQASVWCSPYLDSDAVFIVVCLQSQLVEYFTLNIKYVLFMCVISTI